MAGQFASLPGSWNVYLRDRAPELAEAAASCHSGLLCSSQNGGWEGRGHPATCPGPGSLSPYTGPRGMKEGVDRPHSFSTQLRVCPFPSLGGHCF